MRLLVVEDSSSQRAEVLAQAIARHAPDAVLVPRELLQRLLDELAQANLKLAERKLVERAKGLLMKARGLDEDGAYHALRRMAMDQNKRIGEVARGVIEMAQHLG